MYLIHANITLSLLVHKLPLISEEIPTHIILYKTINYILCT